MSETDPELLKTAATSGGILSMALVAILGWFGKRQVQRLDDHEADITELKTLSALIHATLANLHEAVDRNHDDAQSHFEAVEESIGEVHRRLDRHLEKDK